MCICNALGWFTIDWDKPHATTTFVAFTILIPIGYAFLWFYWKGHNWARIAVLSTGVLTICNLRYWQHGNSLNRFMIGTETALGIFLIYWLNTARIREYFKAGAKNR
jgi:putative Mn2+ efflux pump MntP